MKMTPTNTKNFKLPEVPKTWLICILLVGLIILRCFGIDSYTTAALGIIIGYLTGVKSEQWRTETKLV